MKTNVIGLSGYAGSGKDFLYSVLSKKLNCKRFALADELKIELNPLVKTLYGVDLLTCEGEDKKKIRPLLVSHGLIRRNETKGRYWIEKISKKIKESIKNDKDLLVIVTDIRYIEHEKDEVYWLKEEINGKLIHVDKYKNIESKKCYSLPPNKEEAENIPIIKEKSDYIFEWEHFSGTEEEVKVKAEKSESVNSLIKWLCN